MSRIPQNVLQRFMVDVLEIHDYQDMFQNISENGPLKLLKKIVLHHVKKLPFQNITMASKDLEKRSAPTIEDIIETAFKGHGGLCIDQNYFLYMILQAIGYDVFVVQGTCIGSSTAGSHCMSVAKIPQDHEVINYLVDVSCGLPIHEPIPLNNLHQIPYISQAGGFKYEYRYDPVENLYWRYQLIGNYFRGSFDQGKTEEKRYSFNLKPCSFEDFNEKMNIIFTQPSESFFLRVPYLFRYLTVPTEENEYECSFIMFYSTQMVKGTSGERQSEEFSSYQEIQPYLKKYFSEIDKNELEKAFRNFENYK